MRLSQSLLLLVGAALSLALAGCNDLPSFETTRVLEIRCVSNTGLDQDKRCRKPEYLSSELEIRVNKATRQVFFSFLNSRGEWYLKDFILDGCTIADANNWKCSRTIGKPGTPIYMVSEYGMTNKRFYHALTDNGPSEFYTSGISGLTYWAYHYGLISTSMAMRLWGYPGSTRLL